MFIIRHDIDYMLPRENENQKPVFCRFAMNWVSYVFTFANFNSEKNGQMVKVNEDECTIFFFDNRIEQNQLGYLGIRCNYWIWYIQARTLNMIVTV